MPYRVILSRRAEDEFDTLPAHVRKRVARWINLLADDPRRPGVKKLEGHDDLYRVHASRDHVYRGL